MPQEQPLARFGRMAVALLVVLANLVITLIVVRFRRCRQSTCNILIGVLAFVDVIEGVALFLRTLDDTICGVDDDVTISINETIRYSKLCCFQIAVVHTFAFPASQALMLCVAVDRFFALRNPFKYGSTPKEVTYVTALIATAVSFLWGSVFVVLPFTVGDTVGSAPVCSIGQYAPPIWDGLWTYGINGLSVMVLGMYVICLVTLHVTAKRLKSMVDIHAMRTEKRLMSAISYVILLYAIFHVLPNATLTVHKALGVSNGFTLSLASFYRVSTGLHSAATIVVYMIKHKEIRACFRLMSSKVFGPSTASVRFMHGKGTNRSPR